MLGALWALPVVLHAQTPAEPTLPTVTVTAEEEAPNDDAQAFSTVGTTRISSEAMTQQQAQDIKDLVRYEPGVSVTNKSSRFGLAGFNIRGLEGNRVLVQIDGVRVPDTFAIGGYSNASRDLFDIELLDELLIERGTGSAKSGSDALGGTVAYRTPRPEDILQGRSVAGSVKTQYESADKSTVSNTTVAAGNEQIKLLLRGVKRHGHETETQGSVGGTGYKRDMANPQDKEGDAALAKLAITPSAGYRAELAYLNTNKATATDHLSNISGLAASQTADDTTQAEQWALNQRWTGLPVGEVELSLFRQSAYTRQYTLTTRRASAQTQPTSIAQEERYFHFKQRTTGLKLDGITPFQALGSHQLFWGAEGSVTDTEQMRDGYTTLKNGTVNRAVSIDTFPTRETPLSETTRSALYLQDEWYATDRLTLIAGGRYDHYRLTPRADEIYLSGEGVEMPTEAKFSAFSPKIGAIWRLDGGYSLHGQYSHGFRPPPYDDVNIGFYNSTGYTVVANPDLRPETSRGVELMLRHADTSGTWSVTLYDNHYTDFIETVGLDCPANPACSTEVPLTYQSQNLPKVRIHGLEARLAKEIAPGWAVRGSLAYAKGRNTVTQEPIYSINPVSGALALIHTRGAFRYEVATRFADGKKEADAEGSSRLFLPGGYAVVDARLSWTFAKNSAITFGVNNLFDRKYHEWADVPVSDIHIVETLGGPDRYSQPGRNYVVTLVYAF